MSGYAIIVDFRLKPGALDAFRRLIDANARLSLETEAGCRRFDVLEPQEERDRVVLYEIYDDEAAFAAHARSRHFEMFDLESAPLVLAKTVTHCTLAFDGGAPPWG